MSHLDTVFQWDSIVSTQLLHFRLPHVQAWLYFQQSLVEREHISGKWHPDTQTTRDSLKTLGQGQTPMSDNTN